MPHTMAVYEFQGDTEDLITRYDAIVHKVVETSSGRPIVHLAVPRDTGLMIIDVWSEEPALRRFIAEDAPVWDILREFGLPEPEMRILPVHNLGWPVSEQPMYR